MLRCSMNNKARESYPATTRPSSVSVPAGVIIFESRRGRDTPAVTGIRSLLQQRGTAARPAFQDIRRTKRDVSTKRRHWYPSSILLPFGVVDISSPTPGTWHFLFQTFSPFVSCISFSSSSSSSFIYLFIYYSAYCRTGVSPSNRKGWNCHRSPDYKEKLQRVTMIVRLCVILWDQLAYRSSSWKRGGEEDLYHRM